MEHGHPENPARTAIAVPAAAAALAAFYLAAALLAPTLVPIACVAAVVGACSLVLAHRPAPGLRAALAVVAAILFAGFAVAWLLSGHPTGGFVWTVAALFLLPLPLIPWLYARTFGRDRD